MPKRDSYNDDNLFPIDETSQEVTRGEIVPAGEIEFSLVYEPDINTEPIIYGEEMQAFGIGYPLVKAVDTVDRRVVIIGVKQFKSNFAGQEYALFCRAYYADTAEKFNVVYGGKAIMEMIIINALQGHNRPISFIPRRKVSGAGREYWYCE